MTLNRLPLRLGRWLAISTVLAAVMLGVAGRSDQVMLNAYVAMCTAVLLLATLAIDPEVAEARLRRGPPGEDPLRLLIIRLLFLATLVLAPLDVGRFHWSGAVPRPLQISALIMTAVAMVWIVWAVSVNRFFMPVVRIQSERGHHVVDRGPYARVRHPGYAGMVWVAPGTALALGSWWALLPGAVLSVLFLRRTVHEDRFLHQHLPGYAAYAARVRYRLIPGVW